MHFGSKSRDFLYKYTRFYLISVIFPIFERKEDIRALCKPHVQFTLFSCFILYELLDMCVPKAWSKPHKEDIFYELISEPGHSQQSCIFQKLKSLILLTVVWTDKNKVFIANGQAYLFWFNELEFHASASPGNEVRVWRIIKKSYQKLPQLQGAPPLICWALAEHSWLLLNISYMKQNMI